MVENGEERRRMRRGDVVPVGERRVQRENIGKEGINLRERLKMRLGDGT